MTTANQNYGQANIKGRDFSYCPKFSATLNSDTETCEEKRRVNNLNHEQRQ